MFFKVQVKNDRNVVVVRIHLVDHQYPMMMMIQQNINEKNIEEEIHQKNNVHLQKKEKKLVNY